MSAETVPLPTGSSPIYLATVVATEGERVGLRVPGFGTLRARVATDRRPRPGERAVVALEASGEAYVIGILADPGRDESPVPRLEPTPDGRAYRLEIPEGDLELRAAQGRIALLARDGVEVEALEGEVDIRAAERVRLESAGGRSRLTLDGDAAELRAGLLEAKAARLRILAEDLSAVAARADCEIESMRARFETVETEAQRFVQRAGELLQVVEDLAHTQAGRLRFSVRGSFHALAERAQLAARKVFRVDGEEIHLG